MKTQELAKCINDGSTIYTTAPQFLSRIAWNEDTDLTGYIVEINRIDDIAEIIVTFVPQKEFESRCYNTDFSEIIKDNDEQKFIEELCKNSEIFTEKHPRRYTNL